MVFSNNLMNPLSFTAYAVGGAVEGLFSGVNSIQKQYAKQQLDLAREQNRPQMGVIANQNLQTQGLININKLQQEIIKESNTLQAEISLSKIRSAETLQAQTLLTELQMQRQRDLTALSMSNKINQAQNNQTASYLASIEQSLIRGDVNAVNQATQSHQVSQQSLRQIELKQSQPLRSDLSNLQINPSSISNAADSVIAQAQSGGAIGTGLGIAGIGLLAIAAVVLLK